MNRSFYSIAIFLWILSMAIAVLHSITYFRLGNQVYALDSIRYWYGYSYLVSFAAALLLLKYFHHRKFMVAFWTGSVALVASFLQFAIFLSLLMGARQWAGFYMPVALFFLASTIVESSSFVFSAAGQRRWLKITGVFGLLFGLVLMSAIIWSNFSPDVQKNVIVEKINQWITLIGAFVPLFLVKNFLGERKIAMRERRTELKENPDSPLPPPERSLETYLPIGGVVAVVVASILGTTIVSESAGKLSWEKQLAEKAKEWRSVFETRTYRDANGDTLQYQLLKPLDYDPQKKYPIVVCLPYSGGVEGSPAAQHLLTHSYRQKYPAFLFVPYCVEGAGWGGIPNYPTIDTLVFESILALEQEFKTIDAKRRYVTGVSRGGYGSWHFIGTAPDMFAAAVPVCGGADPDLAANMTDVAVWAFHGEDDRNVPVELSRDMIAAMKNAGADPKYTEYPDAGHNIWEKVKATPELLDWLFAQQRN